MDDGPGSAGGWVRVGLTAAAAAAFLSIAVARGWWVLLVPGGALLVESCLVAAGVRNPFAPLRARLAGAAATGMATLLSTVAFALLVVPVWGLRHVLPRRSRRARTIWVPVEGRQLPDRTFSRHRRAPGIRVPGTTDR